MTLSLFAAAWYLVVISVVIGSAWLGHQRRKAEAAATLDETYEDRRRRERGEHLARVREEELAELRRAAHGRARA